MKKKNLIPFCGIHFKNKKCKILQRLDVRVNKVSATHLKCRTGLTIVGVLSSKGSIIIVKPEKEKNFFLNPKLLGNIYSELVLQLEN